MSNELSTVPSIITTLAEVQSVAKDIEESKMYSMDKHQAVVLMLLSQGRGIAPVDAITRYHLIPVKSKVGNDWVVTGYRPSMSASAMLGAFQQAGGSVEWHSELTDPNTASATFTHPKFCPKGVKATLTMKQLDELGISLDPRGGRKTTYKQNPDAMLRARLIAKVMRAIAPVITEGMHTPEELKDIEPEVVQTPTIPATARVVQDAEVVETTKKDPPPKTKLEKPKATEKGLDTSELKTIDPNVGTKKKFNEIVKALSEASNIIEVEAIEDSAKSLVWSDEAKTKIAEAVNDATARVTAASQSTDDYGSPSPDDGVV